MSPGLVRRGSPGYIGIEVLLGRIVNIAPQHGDTVREIRSSPDSHVNQFAMRAQYALLDFCVDFGRAVGFAVSDIRVKRRAYTGGRKGVKPHGSNEVVNVTADVNAENAFLPITLDMHSEVKLQSLSLIHI